MGETRISLLEHSDLPAAARVLSQAMLANPLHEAVFLGRGEDQRRAIERMFAALLRESPGVVFVAREGARIVGVMRMQSCRGSRGGAGPRFTGDERDLDWRQAVWHVAWARRDPVDQHWHLGPIGVLPSHQGLGIGSRFMTRFCQEVDACGATAYLETDRERNQRFYEKFGFRLVAESAIFAVRSRYMARPAMSAR